MCTPWRTSVLSSRRLFSSGSSTFYLLRSRVSPVFYKVWGMVGFFSLMFSHYRIIPIWSDLRFGCMWSRRGVVVFSVWFLFGTFIFWLGVYWNDGRSCFRLREISSSCFRSSTVTVSVLQTVGYCVIICTSVCLVLGIRPLFSQLSLSESLLSWIPYRLFL